MSSFGLIEKKNIEHVEHIHLVVKCGSFDNLRLKTEHLRLENNDFMCISKVRKMVCFCVDLVSIDLWPQSLQIILAAAFNLPNSQIINTHSVTVKGF